VLDWGTLRAGKGSFLDSGLALHPADLLYEVDLRGGGTDYLAQGASTDRLNADELRRAVTQALSGGGELMMTIAEQWVQEGRQEGRQESEALLLRRLLIRRFGSLPGWVEAKLAGAKPAQLRCGGSGCWMRGH
jgi:hypothetical protein